VDRAPLVTGGTGFAGAHLIDHLLEHHDGVDAWANPGGRPPSPRPRVQWQAIDLLDAAAVRTSLAARPPAAVYHCAGAADVNAAWRHPARALRVNALGTHHLLDAIRRAAPDSRVLVVGSGLIYRPSPDPLREESAIGPSNPYGFSKLAQEMMAARAPAVRAVIARPFNHIGPGQSDSYVTSSFARQIAEAEAGLRPPVMHVGNLETRRDLTDVRDTVRAYRLLMQEGREGRPYNVCSGRAYLIKDLLSVLLGMALVRIRIETDPARLRPNDNPIVLGDPSRTHDETGWEPRIPIEHTLGDLLNSWRDRVRGSRRAT
jgi:GDP-4-dehydro-6-deoxy-D-mannose reductase